MRLVIAICMKADVYMIQSARTQDGTDDPEGNWEEYLSSGSESDAGDLMCECTPAILLPYL
jgi:hypothetical protein